jgi:penicillin amidase
MFAVRRAPLLRPSALCLLVLLSCKGEDKPAGSDGGGEGGDGAATLDSPIFSVSEGTTASVAGLSCPAHVLRTEGNVPHIFAHDRADLAFATGYVFATDRYFFLDLARRLSLGRVSALLGDAGLESDLAARATGMTHVADVLLAGFTPEEAADIDAYAAGVNAYIEEVRAGRLPPPSELVLAAPLVGASSPIELMEPFSRRDLAGALASLVYELGFETEDVGATRRLAELNAGVYAPEVAGYALREAGALSDVWARIDPLYADVSAPDWPLGAAPVVGGPRRMPADPRVPLSSLRRLEARMERLELRLGHDDNVGWGSNSWAVTGAASADGRALVAGDGHLPLTVPSLFWQVGLNDAELGGGQTTQLGLGLPGFPYMAVGTNGKVAWSQTQLGGDITDWYREELVLGEDGLPSAARGPSGVEPLVVVEEQIEVADVPLLGSVGRTEVFQRYTTADGRFLLEVEGLAVSAEEAAGRPVVNLQGLLVVPGDVDGDGVITGISFDYTGLDSSGIVGAVRGWGLAESVADMNEAARGLVAYSQNIVAADVYGDVLYTSFQAVPCRDHYPRQADGTWSEGADPTLLIDGTRWGGFSVPLDAERKVDTSFVDDPVRCMIPQAEVPFSISPAQGFVQTANNDPGGYALDGVLENSRRYIGGPWDTSTRANRIHTRLTELVGTADMNAMMDLQADHTSPHGRLIAPAFVEAVAAARALNEVDRLLSADEQRLVDLYNADAERLDEAAARLDAWAAGGFEAASGVATFYEDPAGDDAEDSVATMIFNESKGHLSLIALDDEAIGGLYRTGGNSGRLGLLVRMIRGRGAGNPEGLASWDETTLESVYWDRLGTEAVERSDEVLISALIAGLDSLSGPSTGDGLGGFATEDMDQWRWGLRHMARFESVLAEFLGSDGAFGALTAGFAITPDRLPLEEGMIPTDPRYRLPWFPRPGDTESVDAANTGFNRGSFSYGSGPVFRMVFALGPDAVEGYNVLPGGQSALTDSPYFDDQAALWLGNEAMRLRITVEDKVAGATTREVLRPLDDARCGEP